MIQATKTTEPPRADQLNILPAGAPVGSDFTDGSGEPAAVGTRFAVLHDERHLYVTVRCEEPLIENLVRGVSGATSAVFSNDAVEIFVSAGEPKLMYRHFAANPSGGYYTARVIETVPAYTNTGNWTVDAHVGEDYWSVVMSIPWDMLDTEAPQAGDIWRLNVCRQRRAGGDTEVLSWSPVGGSFHQPERFGILVFEDDLAHSLERGVVRVWEKRVAELKKAAALDTGISERIPRQLESLEAAMRPVREGAAQKNLGRERFRDLVLSTTPIFANLHALRQDVGRVADALELRQSMSRRARPGQRLVVFPVKAVTSRRILPHTQLEEPTTHTIRMRACRGEYEPASFVVSPVAGDDVVQVSATDLEGAEGSIPASAIDVRAVKRWYQSGYGDIKNENRRLLVPELLLHDDSLVKVDERTRDNFVRLRFADGREQWKCVSGEAPIQRDEYRAPVCPISDADTLRPVAIAEGRVKQFWVTVHVPPATRSGEYRGRLVIESLAGAGVETLDLTMRVLPFDLAPNHLESSIYYHWGSHLEPNSAGGAHFTHRNIDQYRWEMENLLAHGIENPTVGVDFELLPTVLQLRAEVGMKNDNLYYLTASANNTTSSRVTDITHVARDYGFEEVYFYGHDEARGEALRRQRENFERIHELGGKTFVAGYQGSNFPELGDVQDLLVCAFYPSAREAALWHSKGGKIFCYGNPQAGVENPEIYRRNYGLLLDASNYDGGMTYIYYHGWNDFNIQPWRQHNFIYPTTDGGIDTIQWEGYREGIDDLRYMNTLRQAAQAASRDARPDRRAAAEKAMTFADNLDINADLDELRDRMIEHILELNR